MNYPVRRKESRGKVSYMSRSGKKLRWKEPDVIKGHPGKKNVADVKSKPSKRKLYFLLLLGSILLAVLFSMLNDRLEPEQVTIEKKSLPEYGSAARSNADGWVQFHAIRTEKIGKTQKTGSVSVKTDSALKGDHRYTNYHFLYLLTDQDGHSVVYDDSYTHFPEYDTYAYSSKRDYANLSPGVFYGQLKNMQEELAETVPESVYQPYLACDFMSRLEASSVTFKQSTDQQKFWCEACHIISIVCWIGALVFLILFRCQFPALHIDN